MTRRYAVLAAALVVVALLLALVARMPRPASAPHEDSAPLPGTQLALAFQDGRLDPGRVSVPKGHRVSLTIVNRDRAPLSLVLGGYQDRVRIDDLAPGGTWQGSFVADLPGEDFPWLKNGQPVGMLAVAGSHLEAGHR